jgi:hypothetical protein
VGRREGVRASRLLFRTSLHLILYGRKRHRDPLHPRHGTPAHLSVRSKARPPSSSSASACHCADRDLRGVADRIMYVVDDVLALFPAASHVVLALPCVLAGADVISGQRAGFHLVMRLDGPCGVVRLRGLSGPCRLVMLVVAAAPLRVVRWLPPHPLLFPLPTMPVPPPPSVPGACRLGSGPRTGSPEPLERLVEARGARCRYVSQRAQWRRGHLGLAQTVFLREVLNFLPP